MKKLCVLPVILSFVMVSSCQKQDSTAEQQLAQRKAELDAREKALDEKEKALAVRQKPAASALLNQKPAATAPVDLPNPELRGLIRDSSEIKAERDSRIQERLAGRRRKIEELQKMRVAVTPPPAEEATSPIPSPTPQ
jgi:hypothetical protein